MVTTLKLSDFVNADGIIPLKYSIIKVSESSEVTLMPQLFNERKRDC